MRIKLWHLGLGVWFIIFFGYFFVPLVRELLNPLTHPDNPDNIMLHYFLDSNYKIDAYHASTKPEAANEESL